MNEAIDHPAAARLVDSLVDSGGGIIAYEFGAPGRQIAIAAGAHLAARSEGLLRIVESALGRPPGFGDLVRNGSSAATSRRSIQAMRSGRGPVSAVSWSAASPPTANTARITPEGTYGQIVELITAVSELADAAAERLADSLLDRLGLYGPIPERVDGLCAAMFFEADPEDGGWVQQCSKAPGHVRHDRYGVQVGAHQPVEQHDRISTPQAEIDGWCRPPGEPVSM